MGIRPETRDVEDRTSQVAGQTREVTGPTRGVSQGTSRVGRPMRREMAHRKCLHAASWRFDALRQDGRAREWSGT